MICSIPYTYILASGLIYTACCIHCKSQSDLFCVLEDSSKPKTPIYAICCCFFAIGVQRRFTYTRYLRVIYVCHTRGKNRLKCGLLVFFGDLVVLCPSELPSLFLTLLAHCLSACVRFALLLPHPS